MATAWGRPGTSSGPMSGVSTSVTTAWSGAWKIRAFMSSPVRRGARLVQLHAAGHVDALTGHVPGVVGGQEGHRLADVLGVLRAPERDAVDELLPGLVAGDALALRQLVEQRLPERCAHDPGTDGVDVDVVLGQLLGEALGDPD